MAKPFSFCGTGTLFIGFQSQTGPTVLLHPRKDAHRCIARKQRTGITVLSITETYQMDPLVSGLSLVRVCYFVCLFFFLYNIPDIPAPSSQGHLAGSPTLLVDLQTGHHLQGTIVCWCLFHSSGKQSFC